MLTEHDITDTTPSKTPRARAQVNEGSDENMPGITEHRTCRTAVDWRPDVPASSQRSNNDNDVDAVNEVSRRMNEG